ncbi:hypothetical protein ASC95_13680 [Pelomonas sp. Root1217]|nr:hypothetical protein ASC95_13680 [Pelomonas sp. Root1217]
MGRKTNQKTKDEGEGGGGVFRVAEVGGSGEIDESSLLAKLRHDKGMTVTVCRLEGLVFAASFTS